MVDIYYAKQLYRLFYSYQYSYLSEFDMYNYDCVKKEISSKCAKYIQHNHNVMLLIKSKNTNA